MLYLNATNKIVSVKPEPAVAAPGDKITLTAYVTDGNNTPVSGATVSWLFTGDESVSTSETDSSGIAILEVTSLAAGVLFYQVYLGSDASDAVYAEACFYNEDLIPPFVPNGMDGELDQYDVEEGVSVIIEQYGTAGPGDIITFWWDNIHSYTTQIANPDTDLPLTIDITNDFPPACLADGDYQLFYQYRDEAKNNIVSLPVTVSVTAGSLAPSLAAPTFPDGDDDGWINVNEASGGTPIQIAYEGMAPNDLLSVTWQLYDEDHMEVLTAQLPYQVTSDDISQGYCQVLVPEGDIPAVQRGSAQSWYQMTPANGGNVQSSYVGEIGVDTVA